MSSDLFMQIGKKIISLDSVDSTNNFAANLIKEGRAIHGQVILAEEQTNGRGQRGANWYSGGGLNLLMSVILLQDNMSAKDQFDLIIVSSLAVSDLLNDLNIPSKIKWPNDIYVDDQKICGMLIENQVKNGTISSTVLGIGLNVNQIDFEGLEAISIRQVNGEFSSMKEIAESLCSRIENRIDEYSRLGIENLRKQYLSRLYQIDEWCLYQENSEPFEGKIIGIDAQGYLLIENRSGEATPYDLKEVKFLKRNTL